MPESYKNKNDVLSDLSTTITSYSSYIDVIIDSVLDIDKSLDFFYAEKIIAKHAFNLSGVFIKSKAYDIILNMAILACIETEEFNYEPYISRLTRAIKENFSSIFSYSWNDMSKRPEITLDFHSLGKNEEWAQAIQAVRRKHYEKLTGRQVAPPPEWRSKFWKEKVYQSGREGRPVIKSTQKGKVDVTSKYSNLYEQIILQRLDMVDSNKAPFWYIINYGNRAVEGSSSKLKPYPSFPETNFVEKTWQYLIDLSYDTYFKFYDEAINYYWYLFNRGIGGSDVIESPVEPPIGDRVKTIEFVRRSVEEHFGDDVRLKEFVERMKKAEGMHSFYRKMIEDNMEVQAYRTKLGRLAERRYSIDPETRKKTQLRIGQ